MVSTLAQALRSARIAAGFTQESAGRVLSVHYTTIANWESGRAHPNSSALPAICAAYKITIASLFPIEASDLLARTGT